MCLCAQINVYAFVYMSAWSLCFGIFIINIYLYVLKYSINSRFCYSLKATFDIIMNLEYSSCAYIANVKAYIFLSGSLGT